MKTLYAVGEKIMKEGRSRLHSRWRNPWRRRERRIAEPGAAIFAKLRTRLTLWYTGVLCGALILFGSALYFGAQHMLFASVQSEVAAQANTVAQQWQESPGLACPLSLSSAAVINMPGAANQQPVGQGIIYHAGPANDGSSREVYVVMQPRFWVVCTAHYNINTPQGTVSTSLPVTVNISDLGPSVDIAGQGSSVIVASTGPDGEPLYWYSVSVHNPRGGQALGAVQVGTSLMQGFAALNALLLLLLIVGGLTLATASLGGLFLANRALVPARVALKRQREFIADASHELRTPLALLRTNAEMLLHGRERIGFSEEEAAQLEDIVTESDHMSTLANNMLTLARIDAGRLPMEHDIINLADVVTAVTRRAKVMIDQAQLTLIAEDTAPALVIGDRTLLEQAVMILLDNAIKYNQPGGSITIRTFVEKQQMRLEVSDTGIGIAPEHLPYVGERFYRVDRARSNENGGCGLGIAIARGIIAAHGGTLTLSSSVGQGTRVTLSLDPAFPA
jgi:signal transduction histidine kinase